MPKEQESYKDFQIWPKCQRVVLLSVRAIQFLRRGIHFQKESYGSSREPEGETIRKILRQLKFRVFAMHSAVPVRFERDQF